MTGRRFISLILLCFVCSGDSMAQTQNETGNRVRLDSRLVRVLTGRNEAVRLQKLAELRNDRSDRHKSLAELLEALKIHLAADTSQSEMLRQSTVELIDVIGSVEQPAAEAAIGDLVGGDRIDIAMCGAATIGRHQLTNSIDALRELSQRGEFDDRYALRCCVAAALASLQHPDGYEALAKLKTNVDGQLRHTIDNYLADLTVEHFGGDQERFAAWQRQDSPPTKSDTGQSVFQAAKFSDKPPDSLARIQFAKPHKYYDIDIHAKRMLFIIDHSGSMKEYAAGATRLMRAKAELTQAIEALPAEAKFSIVIFAQGVRCWRDELVTANRENKLAAKSFVRRLKYGNYTNTYQALLTALEFDDDLEAVFLLTDGRPTTGKIVEHGAIVQDILQRNQWRYLTINAIGISVEGPTEDFLRALATGTAGEFRFPN